MRTHHLSLTHLLQEPRVKAVAGGRPPLLLLLHGVGSNEEDLFGLAPYLDGRFLVVSARGGVAIGTTAGAAATAMGRGGASATAAEVMLTAGLPRKRG